MNPIDKMTLEYLGNSSTKRMLFSRVDAEVTFEEQQKYAERIQNITNNLLDERNLSDVDIGRDVKTAFVKYVSACVAFLREIDNKIDPDGENLEKEGLEEEDSVEEEATEEECEKINSQLEMLNSVDKSVNSKK